MATYYLINNVRVGTIRMYAGALIDSVQDDVSAIQASGGVLVDSSEPTVAAAAEIAQAMRRAGADPNQLESVMLAARNQSLDTVGNATATNQNATAVNQSTRDTRHERIVNPEPNVVSYGTLADDATSANASAQPNRPTTLRVSFASGYDGGDVTVHGSAPDGTVVEETFTAGSGTVEVGTKVFALLDATGSFTADGSGTGSELATVVAGDDIGLACRNATVVKVTEDDVDAAFTQAAGQITEGSFTPTTAKDGTVDYDVWYTVDHTHTQDAHSHTQDAHSHALS